MLLMERKYGIMKITLKSQGQPREQSETELHDFPRKINIFNLEISIS